MGKFSDAEASDSGLDAVKNENDELRRALTASRLREIKAVRKTEDLVEAVYQAAHAAQLTLGRKPDIEAPARDKRRRKPEWALQHLTDWQYGKSTPSYSPTVAQARVHQFLTKALEISEIQREHHPVPNCAMALGGDMIEGVSIFPHQPWEVVADLFDQLFETAELLEQAVRFNLAHYEKVHVVAEWGNHGRLGKKDSGIKASDNMDRILYEIVRRRMVGEKRLTWEGTGDFYQKVEIGNYRAMLIHGDEIKGFGGNLPSYGIIRKANAWASGAVDFKFSDLYIGHYHNANNWTIANGGRVFMTGSTESDNHYAREFVAATTNPSQRRKSVV